MFHDDVQTQFTTDNWKRNNNEHPIDRVLIPYFNTNKQRKNLQSNIQSNNYKSETKRIIQRQRVIRSFLNKPDEIEVRKYRTKLISLYVEFLNTGSDVIYRFTSK